MVIALRSTPRAGAVTGALARADGRRPVEAAVTGWAVPEAAAGEWALLQLVLVDVQARGLRAPCQADPELYFATGREAQEVAAEGCSWCPALAACRAYAEVAGERYGVWGGLLPPARGERPGVLLTGGESMRAGARR